MAKKRGGQRKHWAEFARIYAWYNGIRNRTDITDYELDNSFAWVDPSLVSKQSDQRPRTFEWIRKKGQVPRGRKNKTRNMQELVSAVAIDPRFSGLENVYRAKIWNFIKKDFYTSDSLLKEIHAGLTSLNLVRVDPDTSSALSKLISMHGRRKVFENCLREALRNVEQFSALSLLWLLYLNTKPPHSSDLQQLILDFFDDRLDFLCEHYFDDARYIQYYEGTLDALESVLVTGGYRNYFEIEGTFPIFHKSDYVYVDDYEKLAKLLHLF